MKIKGKPKENTYKMENERKTCGKQKDQQKENKRNNKGKSKKHKKTKGT